jgi:hypothetical protein
LAATVERISSCDWASREDASLPHSRKIEEEGAHEGEEGSVVHRDWKVGSE